MDALEKLESRAMPEPNTGCLLYIGPTWGNNHYGCFSLNGKATGAHQAAWVLRHGPIPEGKKVLHRCDMPVCIEDNHLFLGTQKDNMDDAASKGRRKNSLANLRRKEPTVLNEGLVRLIRTSPEGTSNLARQLGLKQQTVSAVRLRRIWKSLPD